MKNSEQDDTFLSRWLTNQLTDEEKRAFEATEEGKEYVSMMKASELLEPPAYDAESALASFQQRIEETPAKKGKVIWMQTGFRLAVAASVALLITVVWLFSSGETMINTGFSEQEIVSLPDGSEVRLNASSEIRYDEGEWEKERNIALKGEGFFEVEKGVEFNVRTIDGNVRVLGTSFNVRSRNGLFEVKCYTGKVEVSSGSVKQHLTPGEVIRIKDEELVSYRMTELKQTPGWTRGVTELEEVTFDQVLEELQFVFSVKVEYDNSLNDLQYTGAFPNQKPESAFKLVFDPLNVRYSYDSENRTLTIQGLKQ